jgi:M6 family metalloprotease-like protein
MSIKKSPVRFAYMRKARLHQLLLFIAIIVISPEIQAIPAPRKVTTVAQPDGSKLSVYIKGDEFSHDVHSTDGYTLLPDSNGYYRYAVTDSLGTLKCSNVLARNKDNRSGQDNLFLKTISTQLTFSDAQKAQRIQARIEKVVSESQLRSATSSSSLPDGLIADYPTTGTPKSLVILVNFSDTQFGSANTAAVFDSMLNQTGYSADNRYVGSVRDYYKFNSGEAFIPDFVVVGPVTLPKTMAYYGSNDSSGNDKNPAEMVGSACSIADSLGLVDFSNFDVDSDGYVDNVYVFYAGYGEADGGNANSIWPHSWALTSASISLTLDGKIINAYACSAELDGSGKRTGIGTFAHEYGHILGLPDMYDVDYDTYNGYGFDIGEWSLMAYGAYNGDGCVPPCLTIVERTLLGWTTPTVLSSAASATLADLGSSNQGYKITTSDDYEYFLLENRQQDQNIWDADIPYHGLLIYHVDMRKKAMMTLTYYTYGKYSFSFHQMWEYNMVNASSTHQCCDIEEADNEQIIYNSASVYNQYYTSLKGDPFPGTSNNTTFTDTSSPGMLTWASKSLSKPITYITEADGVISFDFMDGLKSSLSTLDNETPSAYVNNRIIYVKGNDEGSIIRAYDTTGILRSTSSLGEIQVNSSGLYLLQITVDGVSRKLKVMVL